MAYNLTVPFIHNLEKLLELCEQHDASFSQMKALGQALTPYGFNFATMRISGPLWPRLSPLCRPHRHCVPLSFHGCRLLCGHQCEARVKARLHSL